MSGCNSRRPHHKICRAPASAAESPKLSLPGAAPGRRASSWGRGRKVMHLPCKQTQAGALPAVLHQTSFRPQRARTRSGQPIQLRETRPTHRDEPHKLIQVGVTPTPATILRSKRCEGEGGLDRRNKDPNASSYGSASHLHGK